jgi:hypothetical protein
MIRRKFFKLGIVSVLFPSSLIIEPKLDWVKILKHYIRRNDVYFIDDYILIHENLHKQYLQILMKKKGNWHEI